MPAIPAERLNLRCEFERARNAFFVRAMDYRSFTIAAGGGDFLVKRRVGPADKRMTPALVHADYVIATAAVLVGKEPVWKTS